MNKKDYISYKWSEFSKQFGKWILLKVKPELYVWCFTFIQLGSSLGKVKKKKTREISTWELKHPDGRL